MEGRKGLPMNHKLIGATLIIVAFTAIGFYMSVSVCTEVKHLRDLIKIISYMECELSYRLTPLANLCRLSSEQGQSLKYVFDIFSEELDNQISPDPARCMDVALTRSSGLSRCVVEFLRELGNSFGKFDLQGQMSEIKLVQQRCTQALNMLEAYKDTRSRNCKTIAFCIGVVITIILL